MKNEKQNLHVNTYSVNRVITKKTCLFKIVSGKLTIFLQEYLFFIGFSKKNLYIWAS